MEAKRVLRLLAYLVGLLSPFMALAAFISLFRGEENAATLSLALPAIGGGLLALAAKIAWGKERHRLTIRESFLFVGLAWFGASAWGALPFLLSGSVQSYFDAFFEAASGFSTTGASIFSDVEALPRSILFWRSMTHWLGGMGIVVLTVAIFPLLGYGGAQLMEAEAPGPSVDRITPRISGTAKILWLLYLGLTALQALLLFLGGMDVIDAFIHAFGTLATGGFSSRNASVGAYSSPYIEWVIIIFMILAGANFTLLYQALSGNWRSLGKNVEFRTYLGILLAASLLVTLDLGKTVEGGFMNRFRIATFQATSILTTTGFSTADFAHWPSFSQGVLFALMFIGGSAGSTAGGIKVGRVVTLFKMSLAELRYLVNPRARIEIFVDGKALRKNAIYDIAAFVLLYALLAFSGVLVLAAAGLEITTALSGTMACLGNIGPGLGRLGPTMTYAPLPAWAKVYLSALMIIGRLEASTVLVLFMPSFWKRA